MYLYFHIFSYLAQNDVFVSCKNKYGQLTSYTGLMLQQMVPVKEEVEKMVPSAEEKDVLEEDIKEEEEAEEEKRERDSGSEESDEDKEISEEPRPQAADEMEKDILMPEEPRKEKHSEDLNLNNEVVKMRKEVKRVKVLIIRKLTRQIAALKKKKGNETEVERNHRRASRVLQEIHALKLLSPDLVGFA